MARQIIGDSLDMALPAFEGVAERQVEIGRPIREPFVVSPAQRVMLQNVAVESTWEGVNVDLIGKIQGFHFIVYFSHQGRRVPPILGAPKDQRCGAISISLDPLPALFSSSRASGLSYRELLHHFLTEDVKSKTWIFHPNFQRGLENARQRLELQAVQYGLKASLGTDFTDHEAAQRKVLFECLMCKTRWQGYPGVGSSCPNCKTHLYSRVEDAIDDK